MKFIKSYKIFESININFDIIEYGITKYTLNEDGSIDCNQNVNFFNKNLTKIPFKFNKINGSFTIQDNKITSLKNCPKYVSSWFDCSYNYLTSLEFGPEYVGGVYYCFKNKLTTLKGCVEEVYGDFLSSNNQLTSLEFCPMQVEGSFNCSDNNLTELDRSPFVRKDLWCKGMFETEPEFSGHCSKLIWK